MKANAVLCIHVVFTVFITLTPFTVLLGWLMDWPWTRDPTYRYLHLGLLAFVLVEVVFSITCPLTVWENHYRAKAGMRLYSTGFFDYWVEETLRIPFKDWMFLSIFFAVFMFTLVCYFLLPPIPL